jgi:hypothetical protein
MPWKNSERWSFTMAEIADHAPTESGVYYVGGADGYIFIGESPDVRAALLQQVTGHNSFTLFKPLWFGFERCPAESRVQRRDEMLAECNPLCNWDRPLVEP